MVASELTVFICTYKPILETLELCCKKIIANSLSPDKVVIIDNNNSEEISLNILKICNRYDFQYLFNPNLGIANSRLLAMNNLVSDYLCFLDDDTLPNEFFFENALNYLKVNPGCVAVGGIIEIEEVYKSNHFLSPSFPYFGARNLGSQPISSDNELWNAVMPITGGGVYNSGFIKYVTSLKNFKEDFLALGRVGDAGLSGEDSFLVSKAKSFNGFYTYLPSLHVTHKIEPNRFKFFYLCKLFYGFGRTEVIISNETIPNGNLFSLLYKFLMLFKDHGLASTYLIFALIGREFQAYKKLTF
jgi:GT2 family glycosyltransferase